MHLLVCSPSWPTTKTIDFVFVDQLCRVFADLGHKVTVIAPQSVTKCLVRHIPLVKRHYTYKTDKGNEIEIFRPYTISFGNSRIKSPFGTDEQAIKRAFKSLKSKPDVCYGHFWSSIFYLYPLAKASRIPLCGASGEENVNYYVHYSEDYKREVKDYLSGIICVSSKNQQECFTLNLVDQQKSIVIPNAIDQSLFYKRDKKTCRKDLDIDEKSFVVAFVGQFVSRKGTLRLVEALKRINDSDVKAVFIGSGPENPEFEGIIHKGTVVHDEVPIWLSAADVFVLPTQNEGCCNAIIEAMACGLPIISSNKSFNWDVLNDKNSIMVDPDNVEEISEAIRKVKEDSILREAMGNAALETASNLSIRNRAVRIIDFIKEKISFGNH